MPKSAVRRSCLAERCNPLKAREAGPGRRSQTNDPEIRPASAPRIVLVPDGVGVHVDHARDSGGYYRALSRYGAAKMRRFCADVDVDPTSARSSRLPTLSDDQCTDARRMESVNDRSALFPVPDRLQTEPYVH
jgi:hypothetical protein